jgi:hypothetical protein
MTFHSALQPAVTSADADACDAGFGDVDERGSMGVHVRFLFSSRTGEALPRRYASPSRIDMDRPARRVHLSHVIRHTCLALPSVRLVQARETPRAPQAASGESPARYPSSDDWGRRPGTSPIRG